jgi:hypothetical protein
MFTVVELLPGSNGAASALNKDGFVTFNASGFSAFLFIPETRNSASGSTIGLPSPIDVFGQPVGQTVQALALNNLSDTPDVVGWAGVNLPSGGNITLAAAWFASGHLGASGTLLPSHVTFPVPSQAQANAINDSRIIAGWSITGDGLRRAVVWDGNQPLSLPAELASLDPSLPSEALGINATGLVVGTATTRDAVGNIVAHAVAWDAATRQIVNDLGNLSPFSPLLLPDLNAQATAVNDNGDIVGVGDLTNGPARMRSGFYAPVGGNLQVIGPPFPSAGAWAVSPGGVAAITTPVLKDNTLVVHGGTFTPAGGVVDIDALPEGAQPGGHGLSGGWLLTAARGVNDAGQICGVGSSPFLSDRAILLSP